MIPLLNEKENHVSTYMSTDSATLMSNARPSLPFLFDIVELARLSVVPLAELLLYSCEQNIRSKTSYFFPLEKLWRKGNEYLEMMTHNSLVVGLAQRCTSWQVPSDQSDIIAVGLKDTVLLGKMWPENRCLRIMSTVQCVV